MLGTNALPALIGADPRCRVLPKTRLCHLQGGGAGEFHFGIRRPCERAKLELSIKNATTSCSVAGTARAAAGTISLGKRPEEGTPGQLFDLPQQGLALLFGFLMGWLHPLRHNSLEVLKAIE